MNDNKIKVLFMGRKNVATKCLQYLLESNKYIVVGVLTDSHLDKSSTGELATKNNIPLYNFEEALLKLQNQELIFDLGISMLYWRKLKEEFISMPKLGTINFHPAPLPDYKGTAGYNLAILDGLDKWGMTAHYVDENIDTGEIIEVRSFPICQETETVKSLEAKSQKYLFDLFKSTIDRIASSSSSRLETTPNTGGRYVSRSEMESMKEIKPGDDISRKIRAFWFPPYDGAYITIEGEKYSLVDRKILSSLDNSNVSNVFGNKNA
ncbi:hypothetical protein Q3054_000849 [Vibrio alginolyticus]|nr:hypothetical protein [Vibrio alginolyticus]